jgi:hypothetical protein
VILCGETPGGGATSQFLLFRIIALNGSLLVLERSAVNFLATDCRCLPHSRHH